MKKVYTLLAIASVALSATAAMPTAVTAPAVKATTAVPQVKSSMQTQSQSRFHVDNKLNYTPQDRVYYDGDEVWTSLGIGKITNPCLEGAGCSATTYEVEIEETPIDGGRKFRCTPFASTENPFITNGLLSSVDESTYMVFYAMEDGKNYLENFKAYGVVGFYQNCGECGFTGNTYATFDGETWTLTAGMVSDYKGLGGSGYYIANPTTPLTVYFPGAKDYTASIQTWICGDDIPGGPGEDASQAFLFSGAEDASYVKYGYLSGYWEFTMELAEFVGLYGRQAAAGKNWRVAISKQAAPGIYTAYVATFDAADNCKDIKSSYFFVLDDDQDNWVEAGTATWNESLYAGSYNNWPTQELTMVYEEHKDKPGYIRLVNPYVDVTHNGESLYAPCEDHNHYIYIDATQPEYVKVQPSVTGGAYDGRGVVMSLSHKYENSGIYEPQEIKEAGYYGTMADNKITFPQKDVVFGEKNYQNGAFLSTSVPFEVTLTPRQEVVEPTITLDQTEATVKVGETVKLTATVENQPQSDEAVTWSSSDEAVATVDSEGVVTGVAEGTATIIASIAGVSATCTITVEKAEVPVEVTITLDQTEATVKVGETVTLTATVEPQDADNTVTWASSDETVATVDAEGVVTGVAEGTATITATCGEKSAACEVTVVNASVEEVWTSIGIGKITGAFLEMFSIPAEKYDVEIEETPIEGGRKFRCLPFSMENNPFYSLGLEDVDTENYMVFYAMEDGKNYFEDFAGYGLVPFSQYVAESGWEGGDSYATFDGEVWTVPVKGVLADISVTGNDGWYYGNAATPLSISLPGAKDYTATIQTWICDEDIPGGAGEGNCQLFTFSGSADAAYVKYGYLPGYWNFTMEMAEFVGLAETQVDSGKVWACGVEEGEEPGLYTAYVATFDAEDNCKDIKSSYFFVQDDDQDNWVEAGTATWNESLYSGSYNNWAPQELNMVYEEHKDKPGYIRLVNPYAEATHNGESLSAPCEGHNHYIYIDATQPEYVKIEPSVTGGAYDGRGVVMSLGHKYENSGIYEPEEVKDAGYYGTMADNKITFPQKDVVFGEKNFQNGAFLNTSVPFELTLTPKQEIVEPTIALDKTEATVKVGETVKLTATVDGNPQTDEVVTWNCSDEAVATVDSEGVVTGVAEGTATITASIAGVSATCTVTVVTGDVNMLAEIKAAAARGELYDLQGRKVSAATKGFVIILQGDKAVKMFIK